MGSNTLTSRSDGDIIPAADHNELVEAFVLNYVPRDAARVATDLAGSLGTSAFRFLRAFVQEYFIGDAGNNLRIYEGTADEIWIERGSATGEQIRISSSGIAVYINGNQIASFGETAFTSINKYINHNSLAAKSKLEFGYFDINSSPGGTYTTMFSDTLNGCLAGKRVIITAGFTYEMEAAGADELDIRFRQNGNVFRTENDIIAALADAAGKPAFVQWQAIYTIPSDGNYTFDMQWRDANNPRGYYRIEEL